MTDTVTEVKPDRQARRREATRGKLIEAAKALFATVNMAELTSGFLPNFSVPAEVILKAAVASAIVGVLSGGLPALRSTRMSVVDGLRRVV